MPAQSRELFIDATRGLAMLGVMVAHFAWIFSALHEEFTTGLEIAKYVKPAAPTFMLISGALLGYIYETRNRQLGTFGIKLIDRGLFLLIAGHIIIWLAYIPYAGGPGNAARFGQITDAIGVAIIMGPFLVTRLGARNRVILGCTAFLLTWLAIAFWYPQGDYGQWVKDTLFGPELGRSSRWGYNFPIVPWVSVYIIATAIGQHLARARASRSEGSFALHLFILGGAGIAAFGTIKIAWQIAKHFYDIDVTRSLVAEYLYTHTVAGFKWPPVLSYYVFFCSISLILLGALFYIEKRQLFPRMVSLLTIIGQNSLFVFLLQEHVYVSLLWSLNPPLNQFWPMILLATILVNILAVYVWKRFAGTYVFTVGYGRVWGPREAIAKRPESIST
jgi:uncharacterized membrane protein